jgi:hypothetical protein
MSSRDAAALHVSIVDLDTHDCQKGLEDNELGFLRPVPIHFTGTPVYSSMNLT